MLVLNQGSNVKVLKKNFFLPDGLGTLRVLRKLTDLIEFQLSS